MQFTSHALIDAAGADVAVPVDAHIIPTQAGWTVYAAFVDAASVVGLEDAPEGTPSGAGGAQAEPHGMPHELQSVHPERLREFAPQLEALQPVIAGKRPVWVSAREKSAIEAAVN